MVFSSLTFLFVFLPLVLLTTYVCPKTARNYVLLAWSLLFYAWGGPSYLFIMIGSIALNYLFGLGIAATNRPVIRRVLLGLCVAANLGALGYFKYFDFFAENLNMVFSTELIAVRDIVLPIGISFYTFQAMSYVIDLYRGEVTVQKNPFRLALYIAFFPQLIAGPIVNYGDICESLATRSVTMADFAYGIQRFLFGLGKKAILANGLGAVADKILVVEPSRLPFWILWLGAVVYAFQIYYDFSGYSDMAIGLGRMFGFQFLENFNYPYLSLSVSEFWRRWHISLTSWFRSYLYIPLGGNRKGRARTLFNVMLVFFLTGLWHGANWQFIAFGLWHGLFMVLERAFLGRWLDRCTHAVRWAYMSVVVLVGWVLFSCHGLSYGISALWGMARFSTGNGAYTLGQFLNPHTVVLLAAAVLLCGPLQSWVPRLRSALYDNRRMSWGIVAALGAVLFLSVLSLTANTYNPFIYFRF